MNPKSVSSSQASEVNYELHTLGWKAFQNLCLTVASELWGQTVQNFFDSNDGGRDGAFHGQWKNSEGDTFIGTFTVQCKFTTKADKQIKLADLSDELKKAERLASKGLADNYFLLTNAKLTGLNEETIKKAFENINGIKSFKAYGCDWISQKIRESARLRMLVPRIYGLGDLSQIMDERAYSQAQEILGALGGDLSKFVITNAFRKSAEAIKEHGFVLLLGEAACGKSTIAAALAIGALDTWECYPIKICTPEEFVKHWNPNEPKQLFWIDDAFGATQVDWAKTFSWNNVFDHIHAAIKKGAKVIFTSRDYVYKQARNSIKSTALPVLKESQVVINVQDLTHKEKEQILYNHIKLGDQEQAYKQKIKPFLNSIVEHSNFAPETARRLGTKIFTKTLNLSSQSLNAYVANPMDFLIELIRTIDVHSQAALALIFMNAGKLTSPVTISKEEEEFLLLLKSNSGEVKRAFLPLDGSLLLNTMEEGFSIWRYKHPTIRDAFAALVAEDSELMDIYLNGAPIEKIFGEVTCGSLDVQGAKVIVPKNRYNLVIEKIKQLELKNWSNRLSLVRFLTHRCNKDFIALFAKDFQSFIGELRLDAPLAFCSELELLILMHSYGILTEDTRKSTADKIHEISVETPDSGFSSKRVSSILLEDELQTIKSAVESDVLPDLEAVINNWEINYDPEYDPEDYYDDLKRTLDDFAIMYRENKNICEQIESSLSEIEDSIEKLRNEYSPSPDHDDFYSSKDLGTEITSQRSIFDDVDK